MSQRGEMMPDRKVRLPASTWFRLVVPTAPTPIFLPAGGWVPALSWAEAIAVFKDEGDEGDPDEGGSLVASGRGSQRQSQRPARSRIGIHNK